MASASSFCCPNPNLISPENDVVSYSKRLFSSSRSLFLGSKLVSTKTIRFRNRIESVSLSGWHPISASCCESFDVVIIGAGIIRLTIARQLLIESKLSVAVVEKAIPCSDATGAGKVVSEEIFHLPKTRTLFLCKMQIISFMVNNFFVCSCLDFCFSLSSSLSIARLFLSQSHLVLFFFSLSHSRTCGLDQNF